MNDGRIDTEADGIVLSAPVYAPGTENAFRQLRWLEIAGLRVVSQVGLMAYPGGEDTESAAQRKDRLIGKSVSILIKELTSDKAIRPKLIRGTVNLEPRA